MKAANHFPDRTSEWLDKEIKKREDSAFQNLMRAFKKWWLTPTGNTGTR